ncbi:unnamed protein product [Linum tenue]|uniref:Acyl carrier protein n=2 Tax=Linum TaxID=4005 RepID=A0AAV0QSJ6_9ROSI|nr:unnamed protein product [Linum tenue]
MASVTSAASSLTFGLSNTALQMSQSSSGLGYNLVSMGGSLSNKTASFPSLRSRQRSRITCAAKAETVEKVCEIVRKQLVLPSETVLTPDSKFSALGADSLDTVEIVMGLEEEFDISVEEESSQNITTIQEAADVIDKLVQKKGEAAPAASST